MMYRYVLRLDIDAVDQYSERILIDDKARRAFTRAYIDPEAKEEHEEELIRKMTDSIIKKLRETT